MQYRSFFFVGTCWMVLGIGVLTSVCGCQQVPVHWAFGRGWDLASGLGRSFDWIPVQQAARSDLWARNPSADALIRATVERGFTAKGYRRASGGAAEFWIDYHVITERDVEWQDFGPVVDYQRGALFLDVIDPATRQVLWRASSESKLELNIAPDEVKRRIEKGVPEMLKRLPDWKAHPA